MSDAATHAAQEQAEKERIEKAVLNFKEITDTDHKKRFLQDLYRRLDDDHEHHTFRYRMWSSKATDSDLEKIKNSLLSTTEDVLLKKEIEKQAMQNMDFFEKLYVKW